MCVVILLFFFFNDTATTEIYTLSLHDALPISWAETERALEALHQARGGPMSSLEFVNPLTGGPAVSTFACEMYRLYPGARTPTRRKTGSSVYIIFQGSGHSVVNGVRFDWGPGD